ncbi:hypothetical protein ES703_114822 [subsurface metagenome]
MEILILLSLLLFAFGMAKFKGAAIFVSINTGTEASPTWTPIGGQREATFDRGKGTIDVTDKDSGGDEEHLPDDKNWSISFGAFLIEGNTGLVALETAYNADELKQFRFITRNWAYKGSATVESLSITGAKGDAAVASFTLKGSGELVKEAIGT